MRIKILKANRFQREWVGFFLDRQPTGCDSGNRLVAAVEKYSLSATAVIVVKVLNPICVNDNKYLRWIVNINPLLSVNILKISFI